jgi:hypothetical protein
VFDEIAAPFLAARIAGAFDEFALALDGAPRAGLRPRRRAGVDARSARRGPPRGAALGAARGRGAQRARRGFRSRSAQAGAHRGQHARARALSERLDRAGARHRSRTAPGFPLGDSLALRLTSPRGAGIAPADTLLTASGGVAYAYLRCAARPAQAGAAARVTVALATGAGRPRRARGRRHRAHRCARSASRAERGYARRVGRASRSRCRIRCRSRTLRARASPRRR